MTRVLVDDPWFYVAAIPAVLLFGVSKGGFGGGLGIVAVPLMALTVSVAQATAIMLPVLLAMDAVAVLSYRRDWDRANMLILAPAALVGLVIGTFTFRLFDDSAIRVLLGVIAVGFALNHWLRRAPAQAAGRSTTKGGFWGALAGFTSFVAHAGGPPLSVYLLPQRLEKGVYVGTTVIFFALVNFAKVVPYAWLGQFDSTNLLTALVLSPLAPIGVVAGLRIQQRIDQRLFYLVVYVFLFVAGVQLILDGLGVL
jgi:uncharacterized membrane protein YfcA